MNVVRPVLIMTAVVALSSSSSSPARAGLFSNNVECAPETRNRRCEWEAELRNARRFERMSCAELTCYAESYRSQLNQRIFSTSFRPVAETRPPAESIAQPRPPAPAPDGFAGLVDLFQASDDRRVERVDRQALTPGPESATRQNVATSLDSAGQLSYQTPRS